MVHGVKFIRHLLRIPLAAFAQSLGHELWPRHTARRLLLLQPHSRTHPQDPPRLAAKVARVGAAVAPRADDNAKANRPEGRHLVGVRC